MADILWLQTVRTPEYECFNVIQQSIWKHIFHQSSRWATNMFCHSNQVKLWKCKTLLGKTLLDSHWKYYWLAIASRNKRKGTRSMPEMHLKQKSENKNFFLFFLMGVQVWTILQRTLVNGKKDLSWKMTILPNQF